MPDPTVPTNPLSPLVPLPPGGGTPNQAAGTSSTAGIGSTTPQPTQNVSFTTGWYVFVACVSGIILAGTRAAPIAFGLLGVATIYQLNLLLEGQ